MLQIHIDENEILDIAKAQIRQHIEQTHADVFLWDIEELCRQTNLSKSFILKSFFYEEDFPKYRAGTKWLMVGEEVRAFLKDWLRRQDKNLNK
ncbi:MAG: group-specific protein [Exiguobacterium sp.]|uniref:group-specific protein n=1 Tax=unclassified Exiguobacterium TaxID=2644629 RepID=UPI001BE7921A|nr:MULTISPECIES: group-specific protein [unclassified Exiguobacterium]MBQ6459529.1 group-specific protein [Exiguobacterium sp.]MBR2758283.1 group-specific protein [Exiguobacterium sp.]MBR3061981.1 group-specific protein [Exiguobacterium sp.]